MQPHSWHGTGPPLRLLNIIGEDRVNHNCLNTHDDSPYALWLDARKEVSFLTR